jgi:hypothetical protein
MMVLPVAWMVIAPGGFESLFKERVRAEAWAAQCGGVIRPLVFGDMP